MSINFPTSLDSLTNPISTDSMSAVPHATQHADANDAIEALEAKVGINGSAVTTSHDYKLSGVTGSDKAVSKTGTETLTNKTLTAPQINMGSDATGDLYYRTSGGVFTRLPIGTSGQIIQVSSGAIPEWIANPAAADASTTVKGVSEEATQAEVDAGTATGGTSARLFINPSTLRAKKYHDKGTPVGGTDAYAFTASPTITAYADGQVFSFEADIANTGPATLSVSSLGAKTIKKNKSSDLETGDIVAGQYVVVQYDSGDDTMQLISHIPTKTYKISNNTYQSADTSRNTSSGTYTMLKKFTLADGFTYRIIRTSFDFELSGAAGTANARIYKNGVAFGTERTKTASGFTTYTEDLLFEGGDTVELWAKTTGDPATVRNFRILGDLVTYSPTVTVTTD